MHLRIILLAIGLSALRLAAQHPATAYPIIPVPAQLQPESGYFQLDAATTFCAAKGAPREVAAFFAEPLRAATGLPLPVTSRRQPHAIELQLDKHLEGDEAYTLHVTPQRVLVQAATARGLFCGMQTFLQLLPPQIEAPAPVPGIRYEAPACLVHDAPRFPYRGVLLDVCRHFFPIEQLKKHIDVLSRYKINNLHLHLTDDQGWRVEIKKYPLLTQVGAWREDLVDGPPYGGFYTQAELRDLVRYAAQRQVNIVPEFEIPGHELAAIASYPWLACAGQAVKPRRLWGVEGIVMCPGKETTFQFLQDVVDELVELFPSPIFHIGGDEAPRQSWEQCPLCQHRADSLGLRADKGRSREAQLQSYIVQRMQQYLQRYHRRLIGWEEILEGGNLSKDAIVMSWRGEEPGIEAAKAGHHVIMTPATGGMYIDRWQGDSNLEPMSMGNYSYLSTVYAYDPMPAAVEALGKGQYILGPQVNLWAEFILDAATQEYLLYPRALALAEVGWSRPERKNFDDFARRVDADAALRLHFQRVRFHVPLPEQPGGSFDWEAFAEQTEVSFQNTRQLPMVYTTDGTAPTPLSSRYEGPLTFRQNTTLKIATLLPCGLMSDVRTLHLDQQEPSPAQPEGDSLTVGLRLQVARGTWYRAAQLSRLTQWDTYTVDKVTDIRRLPLEGDYSAVATALFRVPATDTYYFKSNNALVWVDDRLVVDRDGEAVKRCYRNGGSAVLAAGLHQIRIVFLGHKRDLVNTFADPGLVLMRQGKEGTFNAIGPFFVAP